jgi:hypothetical protein
MIHFQQGQLHVLISFPRSRRLFIQDIPKAHVNSWMHSCLGSIFAKRLVVWTRVLAVGDIFPRRSFARRSSSQHTDQGCQGY